MKKWMLLFGLSLCFVITTAQAQDAPKDSTLKEYAGKYVFPEGSVIPNVVVNFEDGALTMSSAAGTSALVKQETDLYSITSFNGTAKFKRDSNQKIIGVTVEARGYTLEGTKSDGFAITLQPKSIGYKNVLSY
jgi:hypothetical protein